jgi:branched chain amino acid efflux pump
MNAEPKHRFLRALLPGARANFGFAASGFLFGVLFGVASTGAGITVIQAVLMSATMFTAAGQFAALEFWQTPLPYATLAVSTLLISSRLSLFSIAMIPYIRERSLLVRMAGFAFLLDPNAVLVTKLKQTHDPLGYLVGGGLALYTTWIFGTIVGATFTNILTADMVKALEFAGVLFIALVMMTVAKGNAKNWLPWTVAGLSAVALTKAGAHPAAVMIVATLAGTIAGMIKSKFSDA